MTERKCGNCTACCKTHPIFRIDKPGGEWCKHCIVGVGCSVYGDRPIECATFECRWIKGFGDLLERPDRTHVVFDYSHLKVLGMKIASLWEVSEGALQNGFAQRTKKFVLDSGIPVMFVYLSSRQVLFVPGSIGLSPAMLINLYAENIEVGRE